MMQRLTLARRIFLLSFVPVCLLLVLTFVAINDAVHQRVRQDLRDALYNSDQLLNQASADFSRETSALVAKLTDSAGLKASVGLLPEATRDPSLAKQVRATIEGQLSELQQASRYDYLSISDAQGRTVAAIPASRVISGDGPIISPRAGLADYGGVLFQVESVPIEIGGEAAGILTLGRQFDFKRLAAGGEAALLKTGRIIRSTFPANTIKALETQLQMNCPRPDSGCEVEVSGESFVVSTLQREQLGDSYQLLVFRSLDLPLKAFNHAFVPQLIEIGLSGIVFALVCTLVTTQSVTRPLRLLASQLETGAVSGALPERVEVGKGVPEVDLVASAFNRVAAAERRSRSELVVAKQAAEMANRIKTEFLTNISHELRTPINGVLGMTEVLIATGLSEEQVEYAGVIRDSAVALTALIDGILDFSELETGGIRLNPTEMNPVSILDDVGAVMRSRAAKKPIVIEIVRPGSLPLRCIGEDKRIRQVLMHLCENAIKFTEKGFVRISAQYTPTSSSQGDITFNVEDTGIGIAREDLDFVFQPFTQVDGSLTRRHGGTGIGLSITKALVELMGGRIGVKSDPRVGSTFWFAVPADLIEGIEQSAEHEVLETA